MSASGPPLAGFQGFAAWNRRGPRRVHLLTSEGVHHVSPEFCVVGRFLGRLGMRLCRRGVPAPGTARGQISLSGTNSPWSGTSPSNATTPVTETFSVSSAANGVLVVEVGMKNNGGSTAADGPFASITYGNVPLNLAISETAPAYTTRQPSTTCTTRPRAGRSR